MCLSAHSTGGAWGAPVTYRCEWQDRRWRLDAQISRWELGHEGIDAGICLATAIHAPALRFLPCIMAILQIAWPILPHHAMSPMCWGPAFGGPLRRTSSLVSDRLDDGQLTVPMARVLEPVPREVMLAAGGSTGASADPARSLPTRSFAMSLICCSVRLPPGTVPRSEASTVAARSIVVYALSVRTSLFHGPRSTKH
jgi:hypothetical protein